MNSYVNWNQVWAAVHAVAALFVLLATAYVWWESIAQDSGLLIGVMGAIGFLAAFLVSCRAVYLEWKR